MDALRSRLDRVRRVQALIAEAYALRDYTVGTGRFANEHWIGSGPWSAPCHLSKYPSIESWQRDPLMAFREDAAWSMFPRPNTTFRFDGTKRKVQQDKVLSTKQLRRKEYFLLPGVLFRGLTLYNATPPLTSWMWSYYPDGEYWRERAVSEGTYLFGNYSFQPLTNVAQKITKR
jgi:hypothetical protein